jgi:NADH-quinone oxidoreductase E subunit
VNTILNDYTDEVKAILAKYPEDQKRSAVMPLIHLAQGRDGYVKKQAMIEIAEITGVSVTDVASVVGFYTLYHEKEGGRYHVQVCTDLPCALRGADEFLAKLCENIGIKVGETTADGAVTIEEVTCLAGCHHAPMFQVQGEGEIRYHENQSVETALEVVNALRLKAAGKEGK